MPSMLAHRAIIVALAPAGERRPASRCLVMANMASCARRGRSIPSGQWEAAEALAFTRLHVFGSHSCRCGTDERPPG